MNSHEEPLSDEEEEYDLAEEGGIESEEGSETEEERYYEELAEFSSDEVRDFLGIGLFDLAVLLFNRKLKPLRRIQIEDYVPPTAEELSSKNESILFKTLANDDDNEDDYENAVANVASLGNEGEEFLAANPQAVFASGGSSLFRRCILNAATYLYDGDSVRALKEKIDRVREAERIAREPQEGECSLQEVLEEYGEKGVTLEHLIAILSTQSKHPDQQTLTFRRILKSTEEPDIGEGDLTQRFRRFQEVDRETKKTARIKVLSNKVLEEHSPRIVVLREDVERVFNCEEWMQKLLSGPEAEIKALREKIAELEEENGELLEEVEEGDILLETQRKFRREMIAGFSCLSFLAGSGIALIFMLWYYGELQ